MGIAIFKKALLVICKSWRNCTNYTHVTFKNILSPKGQITSPRVPSEHSFIILSCLKEVLDNSFKEMFVPTYSPNPHM